MMSCEKLKNTTVMVVLTLSLACGGDRAQSTGAPPLPIVEIRGTRRGPTVAFVAGVHGGKVAAVRAIEALATQLDPDAIIGTVLLVGPANLAGYRAGLAQTSPDDSLNLNRVFPGRADGLPTERLAARLMREVVARVDYLVDLHGSDGTEAVGRFAYAARPGLDPKVDSAARDLAVGWGTAIIIWDDAGPRTLAESRFLQTAAHLSGVPAITVFEAGGARDDPLATAAFVSGATRLLHHLGVLDRTMEPTPLPDDTANTARAVPLVLARRDVLFAPSIGRWSPAVNPGLRIRRGELLGQFSDSSGANRRPMRASVDGVILHQRLDGTAPAGSPLVIIGLPPASAP